MRSLSISNLTSLSVEASGEAVTPLALDALLCQVGHEATQGHSLLAMTAASFGFQAGSLLSSTLLRSAFPVLHNAPQSLRFASSLVGLGMEVVSYEGTQRGLESLTQGKDSRSNLWTWEGEGGWKQALVSGLINFGTLKAGNSLFACQNLLLRDFFSNSAMVAGHHVSYFFGLEMGPKGSLSEQFAHAAATNLGISAGMALFHKASGHRSQSIQAALHRSSHLRSFEIRQARSEGDLSPVTRFSSSRDGRVPPPFSSHESLKSFLERHRWSDEHIGYLEVQVENLLERKIEGSDVKRKLFNERLNIELKHAVEAMEFWNVDRQLRVITRFYATCLVEKKALPNLSGILKKLRNTFPVYKDPERLFQDLGLLLTRVPPESLGIACELFAHLSKVAEGGAQEFIEIIDCLPSKTGFENAMSFLRQYVQHHDLMGGTREQRLRHLRMIRDILQENPHSGHYLVEALYEGLEAGLIPLALENEAEEIQNFVSRSGFFSVALFHKYRQRGEEFWPWLDKKKQSILDNDWDPDLITTAYGAGMDFELALFTFPPSAKTSGNLNAVRVFWEECRHQVARPNREVHHAISTQYKTRLEVKSLTPVLSGAVEKFWRQVTVEEWDEGVSDRECRQAMNTYAVSTRDHEDALQLGAVLFRYFLSDWRVLDFFSHRGPIDAVRKRALILDCVKSPEFRNSMQGLCDNLFEGDEAIFELPQTKRKRIDPRRAARFVASLEQDWQAHRGDAPLLSRVIGSKVMAFETEDIRTEVLPLVGDEDLAQIIQDWSARNRRIPRDRWMDHFLARFIESLTGKKSDMRQVEEYGYFSLRSAHGPGYALLPCYLGLCTWDDVSIWTNPDYDPWAFVSEMYCVGMSDYLLLHSHEGQDIVWIGLNVHPSLSERIDAHSLFNALAPLGGALIEDHPHAAYYVAARSSVFSNTLALQDFIDEQIEQRPLLNFSPPIAWNQKPEPYWVDEVFEL